MSGRLAKSCVPPEIGDKAHLLSSMTDENVYILGISPVSNLDSSTVFVIGDCSGNAMPINERFLRVTERTDITKARARRLRESLIAKLEYPEYIIVL